ncbi:MAG: D-tyrosyl-tRNA(Tyr) deacylase [Clostridia bacterium]|nr:D-tyrosyl-tRNA(Tyr) deacylase [Clostridia bacterium]
MKVVLQRVKSASLSVDGEIISQIGKGIVCFVGFKNDDTEASFALPAKRICGVRIFEDENGKMNLGIGEVQGEIMLVSNFTLYGDLSDGYRPSFTASMKYDEAGVLFEKFTQYVKSQTSLPVKTGVFGADMQIVQENDGPITLIIEN